ncbi:hypothetical protein HYH03_017780 [Edaphochlamys debaryana]|uniref:Protein kinase domain-containing protein n=1 Tax=Edaphochlamys debaryana TaxID=47281 RepID=A0A835XF07_9CHLO|nr:hypothetical protein HYH03_017780 [Edaphochlamys debaryana]|eukprot:KAG2483332.1 hypothetical protein HYH03_017780 [Edaphochlamys debaryana]
MDVVVENTILSARVFAADMLLRIHSAVCGAPKPRACSSAHRPLWRPDLPSVPSSAWGSADSCTAAPFGSTFSATCTSGASSDTGSSSGSSASAKASGFTVTIRLHSDGSSRDAVIKILHEHVHNRYYEREVKALEAVRGCPYIVQIYGACEYDNKRCIVMERVYGKLLYNYLGEADKERDGRNRTVLPYKPIARLAHQLLTAVGAMHRLGLAHNDIKPHNIIYRDDGSICLLDLGIAAWEETPGGALDGHGGTLCWMSREMEARLLPGGRCKTEHQPSKRCDLVSVGGIVAAATAWGADHFMVRVFRDYEVDLPSYVPEDLYDFVCGLMWPNPEERMSVEVALAHPFLQRKDGDGLEAFPSAGPPTNKSERKRQKDQHRHWKRLLADGR